MVHNGFGGRASECAAASFLEHTQVNQRSGGVVGGGRGLHQSRSGYGDRPDRRMCSEHWRSNSTDIAPRTVPTPGGRVTLAGAGKDDVELDVWASCSSNQDLSSSSGALQGDMHCRRGGLSSTGQGGASPGSSQGVGDVTSCSWFSRVRLRVSVVFFPRSIPHADAAIPCRQEPWRIGGHSVHAQDAVCGQRHNPSHETKLQQRPGGRTTTTDVWLRLPGLGARFDAGHGQSNK